MKTISDMYLKQVKILFPIKRKKEKAYIRKIKQQEIETIPENTLYTLDDLYEKIGNPKDLIWEYYNLVEPVHFQKRITIKKYIWSFFAVLLIAVAVVESYGWYTYQQHYEITVREKEFIENTN